MSEPRPRPPAAGGPWLMRGLFAAGVLLYSGLLFTQGFQVGDEGVALVDAWRIASGQIPHRDFFEVVPPGSFLPTAFLFKLFGPSVAAARSLTVLYALLLGVLVDAVACNIGARTPARAFLLAFLIPFGVWSWPMPSHHWVATLCQVAAVLCLLRASRGGPRAGVLAAVAGSASGFACASLQDQGAYFVLLLVAGFLPWGGDRALRRRIVLGWSVGVVAVAAAFALYLLPRVPAGEIWNQLVAFPSSRYREIAGNRGGILLGWEVVRGALDAGVFSQAPAYFLTEVAAGLFLTLLPVAALGILAAAFLRRWLPRPLLGLLAAGVLAALGGCLHRWALTNLLWAAPLLLVPVALFLARVEERGRPTVRLALRWAAFGMAALWLINAASFAWLCRPSQTVPVSGPGGTLRSFQRVEASTLQETLAAIDRHVPQGSPLFCEGYVPLIGFLSLRPNPTRFTIFLYPTYNTDAHMRDVLATLEARRDAHVLILLPLRLTDPLHRFVATHDRLLWRTPYAALFAPPGAAGPPPAGSAP